MHATRPGVPGLHRAQLLRPNQDDRSYLAVLEFADEAAYTAYTASGAFHAAHQDPSQSLAEDHRLTTYHTVAHTTG
jgi:heme-degrading monooxygenase HmoA